MSEARPGRAPVELEPLAYRVSQASKLLNAPKSSLHDAIRRGDVRAVRLPGTKVILIPRDEIIRILAGK